MDATLLNAELHVEDGTYVVPGAGGGQSPKIGWKSKRRRAPVIPRIRNTITVSIPKNPRGLMNREGKTIFRARRRVRSSLSQIHLRSAMIGSKTPFFPLVCAANSGCPIQIRSSYVCSSRIIRQFHARQREKSKVEGRTSHGDTVRQPVLAPVTRALQPELSRAWVA